ncbi:OprD family outer membrane porin, partial [Pseudomonas putida]|uniref:OprD family outer membrane porin n=1 Tax=Pseudomonas putida TaxID=303 RepID=UPI0035D430A2
ASSAAPPTPDALSNNAPHGSHFRPPTKTHRINSHDNYPDAAGSGDNIDLPNLGGGNLKESEKDVELSYVIQSGTFKDVALRVRHAWYRNDFGPGATHRDDNELRVNVDYTFALW